MPDPVSECVSLSATPAAGPITPPEHDIDPINAQVGIPLLLGSAICLLSVPVGFIRLAAFQALHSATRDMESWARFLLAAAWPVTAALGPILAVLVYVFRRSTFALLLLMPALLYDLAATVFHTTPP